MARLIWQRLFPYRVFRVRGHSMAPTLRDGDWVLVRLQTGTRRWPGVGALVLARHPFRRDVRMIKRVAHITRDQRWVLVGDNPMESQDSRGFGAVPPTCILGRVVRILRHVDRTPRAAGTPTTSRTRDR